MIVTIVKNILLKGTMDNIIRRCCITASLFGFPQRRLTGNISSHLCWFSPIFHINPFIGLSAFLVLVYTAKYVGGKKAALLANIKVLYNCSCFFQLLIHLFIYVFIICL